MHLLNHPHFSFQYAHGQFPMNEQPLISLLQMYDQVPLLPQLLSFVYQGYVLPIQTYQMANVEFSRQCNQEPARSKQMLIL